MDRDRELMKVRRRIERLRGAMVLAYSNHGSELGNQAVLRISQRLDEQLNAYTRYSRQQLTFGRRSALIST